jgi:hypothetical protein
MQNKRWRFWIILATFSLSVLCLMIWRWRVGVTRQKRWDADWNTFHSNWINASNLIYPIFVHPITGAVNYDPNAHITYPFAVMNVIDVMTAKGQENGWGGSYLRGGESTFYSKDATGTIIEPPDVNVEQMHDLRWLVLRTYKKLSTEDYHPKNENFDIGRVTSERRLITEAWVVDLKNMVVIAHHDFVDDPFPEVIRGDDYQKASQKRVEREIGSWVEKIAQ